MENSSLDIPRLSFEFAFNNASFCDRVLYIEIMADSDGAELDRGNVIEVKTLNISSTILAANSPFFFKLFNNDMRESQEKDTTLRIKKSEDTTFTDLLNFMYNNTLSATTNSDLLGVLIIADKFEVTSCIRYCSALLQKRPMSLESALLYLELPPNSLVIELVKPLIDAAKKWLVARFKDINKTQEEAMTLTLSAVEVVLSSDTLQMNTKDDLFEFILKWARAHYLKLEERREILTKRLTQLIPFQYMSCSKLREVLICPDFDHQQVSKLVNEALFFKVELPYGQLSHSSNKCRLIKVEQFELVQPRCIVYFDLKKEECENLFLSKDLQSPSFCLGGRWFHLEASCSTKEQRKSFGLFMYMTKESESCAIDFEYAVIKKSSKVFQIVRKSDFKDSELRKGWGYPDLFRIQWTDFMSKDSEYFIDGILHLRADFTIKSSQD